MNGDLVQTDSELHDATPLFAGTRVPIQTLFDCLAAGDTLGLFLFDFPSVSRVMAVAALEQASRARRAAGRS